MREKKTFFFAVKKNKTNNFVVTNQIPFWNQQFIAFFLILSISPNEKKVSNLNCVYRRLLYPLA